MRPVILLGFAVGLAVLIGMVAVFVLRRRRRRSARPSTSAWASVLILDPNNETPRGDAHLAPSEQIVLRVVIGHREDRSVVKQDAPLRLPGSGPVRVRLTSSDFLIAVRGGGVPPGGDVEATLDLPGSEPASVDLMLTAPQREGLAYARLRYYANGRLIHRHGISAGVAGWFYVATEYVSVWRRLLAVFKRERPSAEQLVDRIRERTVAVALASIGIALLVVGTAFVCYRKGGPGILLFAFLCVLSAFICLLIGFERILERLAPGVNLGAASRPHDNGNGMPNWLRLSLVGGGLLGAILLDFWAVGHLIQQTGGLFQSPYSSIPVTMLVLGGLMTRANVTRAVIFVLGLAYFVSIERTVIFGTRDLPVADRSFGILEVFLFVTAANLALSYLIAARSQALLPPPRG